jgi:protein SCO1/2
MNKRKWLWIITGLIVIFSVVGWVICKTKCQSTSTQLVGSAKFRQPLPVYAQLPAFQLTDSHGNKFPSSLLADKIWVANFIFTSCKVSCPVLSAEMAKIAQRFEKDKQVHFVSISVDPETDTPEKLAAYKKKIHAPEDRWHFLTGDKSMIMDLMTTGFKLGFAGEPVFHTDYFVLVDGGRNIRGFYSQADEKVFRSLPSNIEVLLGKAPGNWLTQLLASLS